MRYAISYVSTSSDNLSPESIKDLLEQATEHNNRHDITGVLLSSETNFFQLIEGEENEIKALYAGIEKDLRHSNLIQIVGMPVSRPAYDGYTFAIITDKTKYDRSNLVNYLHQIEVLDPSAQEAVKRVIQAMLIS